MKTIAVLIHDGPPLDIATIQIVQGADPRLPSRKQIQTRAPSLLRVRGAFEGDTVYVADWG